MHMFGYVVKPFPTTYYEHVDHTCRDILNMLTAHWDKVDIPDKVPTSPLQHSEKLLDNPQYNIIWQETLKACTHMSADINDISRKSINTLIDVPREYFAAFQVLDV